MFENCMALPDRLGIRRVPGGFVAVHLIGWREEREGHQNYGSLTISHYTSSFVPFNDYDKSDSELEKQAEYDNLPLKTRIEILTYQSHCRIDRKLKEIFNKGDYKKVLEDLMHGGYISHKELYYLESPKLESYIIRRCPYMNLRIGDAIYPNHMREICRTIANLGF